MTDLTSKLLVLSLIFLDFLGCSTTHGVSGNPRAKEYSFSEAGAELSGGSGEVTMRTGERSTAGQLQLTPDSVRWIEQKTQVLRSVAADNVQVIRIRDALGGALDGVGLGVLGGLLIVGISSAATLGEDPVSTPKAILVSSFICGGIGAAIGHSHIYEFRPDSSGTGQNLDPR